MTTAADTFAAPVVPAGPGPRRRPGLRLPPWLGAFVVTAVLVAVTGWLNPTFLKPANLLNIAHEQSAVGILAVGMTLVIVAGGIDLSVGSLVALAGGVGVLVLDRLARTGHVSDLLAVLAGGVTTLAIGLAAGTANGLLIAKGRLPAFIATLAALLALRSGAQWAANGGQFYPAQPSPWLAALDGGVPIPGTDVSVSRRPHHPVVPLRVPYELLVWGAVAVGGGVVLTRTRLGRYAVALGSNPRAARYSAVPVDRVRITVYAISGLLAGVAGFAEAARFQSVNSGNAGLFLELYAIAAAVIGGTRMEGGVGSVTGAVIGTLLLGVIRNVMVNLHVNSQAQGVVMGGIIVVAALIQRGRKAE